MFLDSKHNYLTCQRYFTLSSALICMTLYPYVVLLPSAHACFYLLLCFHLPMYVNYAATFPYMFIFPLYAYYVSTFSCMFTMLSPSPTCSLCFYRPLYDYYVHTFPCIFTMLCLHMYVYYLSTFLSKCCLFNFHLYVYYVSTFH